ncbi:armadillo-like helical domain-containing protein 4 isoform X2 [Malaclemys terrapin pileata]|uniref:armadillo-like helical domain-containing protein 4 isoform X2 n=1 Tax=Malaclemys terrapin pileata TaxID=2991368 RepID=UPI0023A83A68|nr:armadillo-like helical domain-containing protein 4 isoform X2 [Malaclemys terrapin pileata]
MINSANFWAHLSSDMSRSIRFHICMVLCSILLSSTSLQCLTFQKPEKDTVRVQQTALAGNGLEDKRMSMQSLENNVGPSEQSTSVAVSEEPSGVSTEPSGTSLNKIFTAKGETQHTSLSDNLFIGSQSLDVYPPTVSMVVADESEFSPTGSSKESSENGLLKAMLTTALTTLNPDIEADVLSSTVSKTTEGGSTEAGHSFISDLDKHFFRMDAIEGGKNADGSSDLSATPQLSNEELPTLHPRTQNLEVVSDYPTSPLLLAHQTADSEPGTLKPNVGSPWQLTDARASALTAKQTFVSTDASLNLETKTDSSQGSLRVAASAVTGAPAISILSDDWDDTKLGTISQVRGSKHEEEKQNDVIAEPPWTTGGEDDEDDVKRGMPFTASAYATTVKLEKNMYTGPAQVSVQGEVMPTVSAGQTSVYLTSPLAEAEATAINTKENTEPVTMDDRKSVSLSLPETVTMTDTKSNIFLTLGNSLKGVTQETMTASQETDATLPVMTPACFAVHETTSEASVTEEESKGATLIPTVSSVAQLSKKSEHSATTVAFTATHLSTAKTPDAEVLTDLVTVSDEEAVTALPESSETLAGMRMQVEELTSRTATLATPALMASSVRRTVVPSVRRISTAVTYGLDRLESEEGEEEEDEEEDEEEEEEEDRDTDSMEESMEGDTELPGFTLPSETSQEPVVGIGDSAAQLAGVSYQVPDTIEWEQQNQGLVRSWMEKLKDKAGYMSGMLVPVGVGIAGALFILGALYSIKIMNRRRRNGSKRHKRKQREFNSMQDRVMLLADSSEDEF